MAMWTDGHGAAGAAGAELFAEGAVLAGSDRGVIQTGGVDRDFVPAVDWLVRKSLRVIRVIRGLRDERMVRRPDGNCLLARWRRRQWRW
jgi:hypothetical protein